MKQAELKSVRAKTIEVWVVLPQRVLLLDIAGPLEVLRRANAEQRALQFIVHYIGANSRVTSSVGLPLPDIAAFPARLPEEAIVIVPGSADRIAFGEDAPQSAVVQDEEAIVAWLKATVGAGHTLIAICSG